MKVLSFSVVFDIFKIRSYEKTDGAGVLWLVFCMCWANIWFVTKMPNAASDVFTGHQDSVSPSEQGLFQLTP